MTLLGASTATPTEELVDRLDVLSGELHVLNDILGELREDIQWAVTNGRLVVALSETEAPHDGREATNSVDAVTLTIRLNAALAMLRQEVARVIEHQRSIPVASSGGQVPVDVGERPSLILFEAGDAVEFELDGETWFGEIARLDDADAVPLLQVGDVFTIDDDGCEYQAEVLMIDPDNHSAELLLSPSMETVTIDWDDAVSLKTPSIRQRTLF